jgi:hypothetical protein
MNRPQRKHFHETDRKENTSAPIVALGQTTKKTLVAVAWLSIVVCLSVAVPTVVNTCHTAYSMHVTILYAVMCTWTGESSYDIHPVMTNVCIVPYKEEYSIVP